MFTRLVVFRDNPIKFVYDLCTHKSIAMVRKKTKKKKSKELIKFSIPFDSKTETIGDVDIILIRTIKDHLFNMRVKF